MSFDPTLPHDISRLPNDGYLIFPLSMSRLQTSQNPEACYQALAYFDQKIPVISNDVVFLYTNGLYYNTEESALSVRVRTLAQMLGHKNALQRVILQNREFVPQAMHFLPWDFVTLNGPQFESFVHALRRHHLIHPEFQQAVRLSLGEREETEANVNFLLEEIAVTHLLREKMVELPKSLVKQDTFRLICYHGPHMPADAYQWQNHLLPLNEECTNPYRASHYDLEAHLLFDISHPSANPASAATPPPAASDAAASAQKAMKNRSATPKIPAPPSSESTQN